MTMHRISHKLLSGLVVLAQLFSLCFFCVPVNAIEDSTAEEIAKQEQIDKLFSELNDLALEKKIQQNSASMNSSAKTTSDITAMEEQIEQTLESFGVKKIEASNTQDISRLSALVSSTNASARAGFDFSMIADAYSVYDYSGTTKINGKSYDYEYFRVVDNKGYVDTALTTSQLVVPVAKVNTTIGALLQYNFSYVMSEFLGIVPGKDVTEWVLGNIFAVLESYSSNSPVVYNNNTGIYSINMISVTEMSYYYIKVNGSWHQCGSRASNISFARSDSFSANINGRAYADSKNYPTWTSSTGHSWSWYLEKFVSSALPTHDSIGKIKIYRNSSLVHTFSPAFISNPMGLI